MLKFVFLKFALRKDSMSVLFQARQMNSTKSLLQFSVVDLSSNPSNYGSNSFFELNENFIYEVRIGKGLSVGTISSAANEFIKKSPTIFGG